MDRLCNAGVKALVIACNTASAFALEDSREHCTVPVVGVIEPVCHAAAAQTKTGTIGIIGTRGTIASGAYLRQLAVFDPNLRAFVKACPLFVPLAEEGWLRGSVPRKVAQTYLEAFAETEIDTLILGCTHYPLLRDVIQRTINEVVGHPVVVLDSASITAQYLQNVLVEQDLLHQIDGNARHRFWVTDSATSFQETCDRFFGAPLGKIEHVDL